MLDADDYMDLILEYGIEGQNDRGRAPTYFLEDKVVTFTDLSVEEVQQNLEAVESAGINTPETYMQETNIPIYGVGDITAIEQELVESPGPEYFLENEEDYWLEHLREFGHRAAKNDLKLDFGLDNFGLSDDGLVFYDLKDEESVWHDEPVPFHMMGVYLERSLDLLAREGLEAPETREMAERWKSVR